jgi:hypothetical protein
MSGDIEIAQLGDLFVQSAKMIDRAVSPIVKTAVEAAAAEQRIAVARRSGKTMRSIKATGPHGANFGPATLEGEAGPTWFVGRLLEHGTVNMPPQPFVANSLDPHLPRCTAAIVDAAASIVFGE